MQAHLCLRKAVHVNGNYWWTSMSAFL
uniref:Uncharacterized protein n=1 Tax=Arundo donax TaxID=35708 RepID=A0A0A9BC69_ARUDO